MIGVFDSGVGGLSVLRRFLENNSDYSYLYLGDNANVPYGNKSPEIIYQYSQRAIDFLVSQGAKLIIIACNSASAQALRRLQQEYLPLKHPQIKVLGVIRPIVEEIAARSNLERIGLIGTRATINSQVYEIELKSLRPDLKIFTKATPLLVPLIEEDWIKKPETKMILKKYLISLKNKQVQALVLACTHYPFLLKQFQRIMGKACLVLDPSQIVSEKLKDYLTRHPEIDDVLDKDSKILKFFTTDSIEKFQDLGERFLGQKMEKVERVSLPLF